MMKLLLLLLMWRVVNAPLHNIAEDLGFSGNSFAQGEDTPWGCFQCLFMWRITGEVNFIYLFHCYLTWLLLLPPGWVVSICLFGAFFGCALTGTVADAISTEHGSNDTWSMYQVGLCEEQTQPFPIFLHIKLSHIVVSLCSLTYNWMLNYRLVILSILSL